MRALFWKIKNKQTFRLEKCFWKLLTIIRFMEYLWLIKENILMFSNILFENAFGAAAAAGLLIKNQDNLNNISSFSCDDGFQCDKISRCRVMFVPRSKWSVWIPSTHISRGEKKSRSSSFFENLNLKLFDVSSFNKSII